MKPHEFKRFYHPELGKFVYKHKGSGIIVDNIFKPTKKLLQHQLFFYRIAPTKGMFQNGFLYRIIVLFLVFVLSLVLILNGSIPYQCFLLVVKQLVFEVVGFVFRCCIFPSLFMIKSPDSFAVFCPIFCPACSNPKLNCLFCKWFTCSNYQNFM